MFQEKNAVSYRYNKMSVDQRSLYEVNVSLSSDYKACVDDISKIAVVMVFYNIVGNIVSGAPYLISDTSLEAIMLVVLGVCFYYLIFKKVIKFNYH